MCTFYYFSHCKYRPLWPLAANHRRCSLSTSACSPTRTTIAPNSNYYPVLSYRFYRYHSTSDRTTLTTANRPHCSLICKVLCPSSRDPLPSVGLWMWSSDPRPLANRPDCSVKVNCILSAKTQQIVNFCFKLLPITMCVPLISLATIIAGKEHEILCTTWTGRSVHRSTVDRNCLSTGNRPAYQTRTDYYLMVRTRRPPLEPNALNLCHPVRLLTLKTNTTIK